MPRVRRRLDRHRPLQMALPSPYRVLCFPEKMTRINHPIFWRPPTWQLQAFPDHPVWQAHSLHSQSPRPPHTRPWLKTPLSPDFLNVLVSDQNGFWILASKIFLWTFHCGFSFSWIKWKSTIKKMVIIFVVRAGVLFLGLSFSHVTMHWSQMPWGPEFFKFSKWGPNS